MIKHGGSAINPTSWLNRYKKKETSTAACAELATFLLQVYCDLACSSVSLTFSQASGSTFTVTKEQLDDEDREELVREATGSVSPVFLI